MLKNKHELTCYLPRTFFELAINDRGSVKSGRLLLRIFRQSKR